LEEILTKGAADAAIAEADQFLFHLHDVCVFNKLRVDVELSHVVDDHSALQVLFVFQNVLE
jgi:hypothetical protein